jgi:hypothetical protein
MKQISSWCWLSHYNKQLEPSRVGKTLFLNVLTYFALLKQPKLVSSSQSDKQETTSNAINSNSNQDNGGNSIEILNENHHKNKNDDEMEYDDSDYGEI